MGTSCNCVSPQTCANCSSSLAHDLPLTFSPSLAQAVVPLIVSSVPRTVFAVPSPPNTVIAASPDMPMQKRAQRVGSLVVPPAQVPISPLQKILKPIDMVATAATPSHGVQEVRPAFQRVMTVADHNALQAASSVSLPAQSR